MQLRYAFRLYPDAAQQAGLARAFGCARVVFNDTVRTREDARKAAQPFPTAGQLSRELITEVGLDPETGGGLYRTTSTFLEKMGISSVDELPSLAPLLPELDTLDLDDL